MRLARRTFRCRFHNPLPAILPVILLVACLAAVAPFHESRADESPLRPGPTPGALDRPVPAAVESRLERWTPPTTGALAPPTFRNVSVHDPAVIRVDGEIWVFGSHLAAARSPDLVRWKLMADGVNPANPLFDNVVEALEETFAWSDSVGLWANEVHRLPDGRFAMYYNLSRLDSPRASLGLALADDVAGPYRDDGILLQSGMWDQPSEDGRIYDPTFHPNTVDPDLFVDQDGTLWMVYGSYSGGIFLLEMDPSTGHPLPGQGYGLHLMGGNHSRIEGAHILYSPDTAYYYLFVSFGGLDAAGGYNVRVARSRDPRGPYRDGLGRDMREVKSNPSLPLFDDASIQPFAMKLMGSHRFRGSDGRFGHGYQSPGHSTGYCDDVGRACFLIFHTRFPGQGEFHQVRVHQLFFNSDDWPVIAPHRFAPEVGNAVAPPSAPGLTGFAPPTVEGGGFPLGAIAGRWQLIDHGKDISAAVKLSRDLRLHADGRVSGALTGHWLHWGGRDITLELDGGGVFQGVLSRGWDETDERWTLHFSVLSRNGTALWGSQFSADP